MKRKAIKRLRGSQQRLSRELPEPLPNIWQVCDRHRICITRKLAVVGTNTILVRCLNWQGKIRISVQLPFLFDYRVMLPECVTRC